MTPAFCPESGKIRHPSESAAMSARRKGSGHLKAYRCELCDAWHLGHSPGTGSRRLRQARRARRTNRKGFRF